VTQALPVAALVAMAGLVLVALPRIMARRPGWRRAPRPALVVWQAVSLAGVVAALGAAPAAIPLVTDEYSGPHLLVVGVAVAVSVFMLARLLLSGHRVGRRLREVRRQHRELVDLIGLRDDRLGTHARVLAHPSPSAYCVPGQNGRMVLTEGALAALTPGELTAVLEHERSHLRARHDLVLEFFTVLHESVPARVRSSAGMGEVRLLVEVLADRRAVSRTDPVTVGRALVRLAEVPAADGLLGASAGTAATRIALLDNRAAGWMAPVMYAFGVLALATPVVLLVIAWH